MRGYVRSMKSGLILLLSTGHSEPGSLDGVQQGIQHALGDTLLAFATVRIETGSARGMADARAIIASHNPSGIVLAPPLSTDEARVGLCRDLGFQHVSIAPDAREGGAQLVCSNDRQGARDAASYLFALGHLRIGFVAGPEHCRSSRERELGYIDALAEHGLDTGADLVAQGNGSVAMGRDAGRLLLAVSPRPTAILVSSDEMAAGLLQAAHEQGVAVPGQLSIMGFGDTPLAEACWPPLTTMRLPWAEMGFTAAIKLIDPANADTQPVEFFCELVTRGSTGPVEV